MTRPSSAAALAADAAAAAVPGPGGGPAGRSGGFARLVPGAGPEASLLLAARHLALLGCRVDAGTPGRLRVAAGSYTAECGITWAGRLPLPLHSEADVQAACGLMAVHGRRHGGRPTLLGVAYTAAVAGVLGSLGSLAALRASARDGRPVRVDTSAAQAALLALGQYLAVGERGEPAQLDGQAPPFTSADGVRFELEALRPEPWLLFWDALGVARADCAAGWRAFEQRYATAVCPLPPALHEATARHGYRDLVALADRSGVDLTPVAGPWRLGAPDAGPWRITPAGRPSANALRAASAVRGGAVEVAAQRRTEGGPVGSAPLAAPLAGLTVVEVARRVQGPLAGHLLHLLGARVIRVEPPGGDPLRGVPPTDGRCSLRFRALNDGKEAVEADLGTPEGRASVRQLACEADAFLHTLAPGKDEAAGLDAASLLRLHPGLVHARASGWGDERGPRPPVGTDFPVQAYAGLAALLAAPGAEPAPSLVTLTDVLGGVLAAEGVLGGLLGVMRTGRGQRVETSLLGAARLLCRPELRLDPDAAPHPEVPLRADLAALCADPRSAAELTLDPYPAPVGPWTFRPAPQDRR